MNIKIEYIYNTFNYGSMMMGITVINQLNKYLKDIKIFVKTLTEKDLERLRLETKANNLYPEDKSVKEDIVIYLGGDDFSEYYSIKRLESDLRHIKELSKEKLVMLIGQTIGPFTDYRIDLSRECLENVKIYTRDDNCMEYLQSINYKNVFKGRDLAFIDLPRQKEVKGILDKYNLEKDSYISVVTSGLINKYTSDKNKFLEEQVNIINNILKDERLNDKKVVLIPHVLKNPDDRDIVKSIIIKLKNSSSIDRIIPIYDELVPSEAREILGNGKFTITCRMHAAVSTFYMRKPAIAISYGVKYEGVLGRGLDMSNLVIEAKNDLLWKENKISKLVDEKVSYILNNYENLVGKINKNVSENTNILESEIEDIMEQISKHKQLL